MKLYLFLFLLFIAIGIASADVSIVNDTRFNIGNMTFITVLSVQNSTNITVYNSTNIPASTLQFYINGTAIRFTAKTNKTLSNISYNSTTDVVTYKGNSTTGGYLNVSAQMNLSNTSYDFKVGGNTNQTRESNATGWVTFNYTGWEVNQYNFEISKAIPTYIPPTPIGLSSSQGNFWINYTWSAGSGNVTNSYNVSHNGTWTNNTILFRNNTVGAHGWSNISVYSFNSSGTGKLNATPANQTTRVANNLVTIGNVSSSYTITAGNSLSIYPNSSDLDGDTPVFARNFTNGTFYTNNGTLLWTTSGSDTGIYSWQINVSDGYGSVSPANFTVTVNPVYSLNLTYTFTETNSSSTWQSISINDSSYADPLANVSILNATSGSWESILTTSFTGGASPVEHVNVIKGTSGNASSYDVGDGKIIIRYNWTNSISNNSLGVEKINVTILYSKSNFLLNITTNTTSVPVDNQYYLEINLSRDANETGYDIYVFNGTGWTLKGNQTSTNWTLANFTLNNISEVINGNVSLRYIDQTPMGTNRGNLSIDYQRIHGITPGSGIYSLNVTSNTTDVPNASVNTLQIGYNVSAGGDNFTLQIWNGSSWNNRTTLNDTSYSYRNITLQSDEFILTLVFPGPAYRFDVLVRYIDMNINPAQQGKLYLDYQRVYSS